VLAGQEQAKLQLMSSGRTDSIEDSDKYYGILVNLLTYETCVSESDASGGSSILRGAGER
jgi:hypothetical protein